MAIPRFEVLRSCKRPAPTGEGAFGTPHAGQPWLCMLMALAVTILLSVLPFKAPSVTPIVLTTLLSGAELRMDTAPVVRDAAGLDHQALTLSHQGLKVAKKPQRKLWGAGLDLSSGDEAVSVLTGFFEPRRADPRDAAPTRSPPRLRLRAPPVIG